MDVKIESNTFLFEQRVKTPKLAIVVPCYNEEEAFPATHIALMNKLTELKTEGLIARDSFVCYVDDGSTDATWLLISGNCQYMSNVAGLRLGLNSGHQRALMAGLEYVEDKCDCVISIDADMQDDIGAMREMIDKYMSGADIVYGVRRRRDSDSWFKRFSAEQAYRLMNMLGVRTVFNHSDYRLLSAKALKELCRFGERNIYLRGLVPLIGFNETTVYYDRHKRCAGKSKYPLRKMVNFLIDGITSFSIRPVRLIFKIGLVFLAIAIAIFIYSLIRYFNRHTIEGWTSLMLSIWFCSGVLLIALGVTGEYVGKIYSEVKGRPRYHIYETIEARSRLSGNQSAEGHNSEYEGTADDDCKERDLNRDIVYEADTEGHAADDEGI